MNPIVDLVAEATVCKAIMSSPSCRREIFDAVSPLDFRDEGFRSVFTKLRTGWKKPSVDLDSTDSQMWMLRQESFNRAREMADDTKWPVAMERVISASHRRRVQLLGARAVEMAEDATVSADELSAKVRSIADECADRSVTDAKTTKELSETALAEIESGTAKKRSVTWGIRKLDQARLEPGIVAVVGARPRVGKTAAMCSCAVEQAVGAGMGVGIICMESEPAIIIDRCISILSGVPFGLIHDRRYNQRDDYLQSIRASVDAISNSRLQVAGGRPMSLSGIRRQAQEWISRYGISCLWIDYVQNVMHGSGKDIRERVSSTCSELKAMSQELSIPIVELAQLNRTAEDAVPTLSQLKEAGAIEEWADAIVLLDRPDAAQPEPGQRKYRAEDGTRMNMRGKAAALISKNRHGPEGLTYLDFDGPTMRFSDLASASKARFAWSGAGAGGRAGASGRADAQAQARESAPVGVDASASGQAQAPVDARDGAPEGAPDPAPAGQPEPSGRFDPDDSEF